MALLFNIPQHLSLSILKDWVANHRDISNLDIACCSHHLIGIVKGNGYLWKRYVRHELLHLLWDPLFVLEDKVHVRSHNATNYIQWLNSRQVRVRSLNIPISALRDIAAIKALDLPSVKVVRFRDQSKQHEIKLADMKTFLTHCPSLTHIDCAAWSHITDDQLALIGSASSLQLEVLSLSGCYQLSDKGLSIVVSQFSHSLRELYVDCISITDHALRLISSQCPQLRKVSLSYCILLSSGALQSFCSALPHLEAIALEDFHTNQLNDSVVESLLQTNPGLKALDLDYCKGVTVLSFPKVLQACPHIRSFVTREFEYHADLREDGREIRKLKLKGCYTRQSSILAMVQSCPVTVHAVDAKECRKLGSHILKAVVDKFGAELESLEVSPWVDVEDGTMAYALQHCPRLQSLSVDYCEGLGDDTLIAIAEFCPQLTTLSVTKCPKVSDRGMCVMLEHCRQLVTLDVTACAMLTDAVLAKISDSCPQLQQLSVLHTSVTREGVLRLMLENKVALHKFFVDKKHAAWLAPQLEILKDFGLRWKKKLHLLNYFSDTPY